MSFNLFPWPISRASTTTSIYKSTKRQKIWRSLDCENVDCSSRSSERVQNVARELWRHLGSSCLYAGQRSRYAFISFKKIFPFPHGCSSSPVPVWTPCSHWYWYWLDKFQQRWRRQQPTSSTTTAQRGVYMVSVRVCLFTMSRCTCLALHSSAFSFVHHQSSAWLTIFMTAGCLNAFLCLHECLHCCGTESETDCRSLSCASITLYQWTYSQKVYWYWCKSFKRTLYWCTCGVHWYQSWTHNHKYNYIRWGRNLAAVVVLLLVVAWELSYYSQVPVNIHGSL